MGEAKRPGGLFYREDGTAIDAEGNVVHDAPTRDEDTDPSQQPGAAGGLTQEERMGLAMGKVMADALRATPAVATADATKDTKKSRSE